MKESSTKIFRDGISISGGGSSGGFAPTNEGTGTVFGDTEAKSSSIKNSIKLLSDNSELMLPLTSAMLSSLRNIESSIGGVTNLIIRQATGEGFNIAEGFKQNTTGKLVGGERLSISVANTEKWEDNSEFEYSLVAVFIDVNQESSNKYHEPI